MGFYENNFASPEIEQPQKTCNPSNAVILLMKSVNDISHFEFEKKVTHLFKNHQFDKNSDIQQIYLYEMERKIIQVNGEKLSKPVKPYLKIY